MTLVDTSVWVDHFRGRHSPAAAYLSELIEEEEDICTCGIILTEVLQGIRANAQYRRTRRLFLHLVYLPARQSAHLLAAHIYRSARKRGVTIRRSVNCIIAACAIEARVPLLHRDRDFDEIARMSKLNVAGPPS
ncbi:MAG: PIN domain-containing protein [Acidobacteriota bacterium]